MNNNRHQLLFAFRGMASFYTRTVGNCLDMHILLAFIKTLAIICNRKLTYFITPNSSVLAASRRDGIGLVLIDFK